MNSANTDRRYQLMQLTTAFGVMLLLTWSYWPTLREMAMTWEKEPDYSHGFLVAPAAMYLLWERRKSRPEEFQAPAWGGLSLILLAGAIRFAGARYFLGAVDGWSLPVAIGGWVWLTLGRRWLAWSWPCIGFLLFLVPLPWRVETYLSMPLQQMASSFSCWSLQCLGLPAIQEGNTILIGDIHLEVQEACSGLRMTLGVTALVFGSLILVEMEWWQRALLLLGIVPLAVFANCARIVATGLLFQYVDGDWARHFSHDLAGWLVIPLAALMLYAYVRYLQKLVIEYQPTVMAKPST